MNHSPEGAQGSANSKTPLALPQQLEAFAAQFNGETRDMLLLAAQSLSRRDNYHTSLTAVRGQLAQSEERVAKLEGALRAAGSIVSEYATEQRGFANQIISPTHAKQARLDEAEKAEGVLVQLSALLSSSKTN